MPTTPTNVPAKGVPYFTPAQIPASGTALDPQPSGKAIPKLFQPLKIRGVEFPNRIFLSPLCQYSANDNGHMTPWHLAHLGGIFTRGPGLSIIEATAILPEGRITPEDIGLWDDSHIEPMKKVVEFAHSQNQKIGIQLAHAGRKASTVAPWLGINGVLATEEVGGWPNNVWGPSPVAFNDQHATPKEATKEYIKSVVEAFAASAKRAVQAGIDVIEIHNAHGYLLQTFLSPISNKRTDEYGGSFENRIRLTIEVVDAVRAVIPNDMPLFLRVSGTEWLEEALPNEPSWTITDTVALAGILATHGVDLLDVSSGGTHPSQVIRNAGKPAYQSHLSRSVKQAHLNKDNFFVGAVGAINSGIVAEEVLQSGSADVVFVGRGFQKNPGLVWNFADDLGIDIYVAHQIEWGFRGRNKDRPKLKAP